MRKLKILCLLATLWLMVGGCRNKNGCISGAQLQCGTLGLAIKTVDGNQYYPCETPSGNCAVYKEDWTYANRSCNVSWETKVLSGPTFDIEYIPSTETATGTDVTKIFYLKANNDIDTLKITYRQKNVCFDLDKFEAYFNGVRVENCGGSAGSCIDAIKK